MRPQTQKEPLCGCALRGSAVLASGSRSGCVGGGVGGGVSDGVSQNYGQSYGPCRHGLSGRALQTAVGCRPRPTGWAAAGAQATAATVKRCRRPPAVGPDARRHSETASVGYKVMAPAATAYLCALQTAIQARIADGHRPSAVGHDRQWAAEGAQATAVTCLHTYTHT